MEIHPLKSWIGCIPTSRSSIPTIKGTKVSLAIFGRKTEAPPMISWHPMVASHGRNGGIYTLWL
jgi:hypothetical protein